MTKTEDITIFADANELFQYAAKDFSQRAAVAVSKNGKFSVVLAGGKTPELFFDVLSSVAPYKESIPWPNIYFFFGDERYVPATDANSNYQMAYKHLFSRLPINPKNVFRIPTEFKDPHCAANEYEKILKNFSKNNECPRFDLVYLGLGENAHTASLMPLSEIVKKYAENPLAANNSSLVVSLYDTESKMVRISLTPAALNNGTDIIFLVTGENKQTAVSEVVNGNSDPLHYPAQLIHSIHGKTLWYLDAAAAGKLEISSTRKNAIFLDSDGVLNKAIIKNGKPLAPTSLAELDIPTEVKPSLIKLKAANYLLICVTNKPDIERGLMTQATVDAIYNKMRTELPLDDVFICYVENSDCYKPKPGLLLSAAKKYNIDLAKSYMIGDRWRDVGAGQNAGCKTIWIDRGYAEQQPTPPADYTAHSLAEATQWILSQG